MSRRNIFNSLQVHSVDHVIGTLAKDESDRGYVFESILHLFLTLKLYNPLREYNVMQGNFNTDQLREVNLSNYLAEPYRQGGDSSDITLIASNDTIKPKCIFVTCKYYNKLASGQDLEISKIHSNLIGNRKYRDDYAIYAGVKNASEACDVLRRMRATSANYILGLDYQNILDVNDLNRMHRDFKRLYGACDSVQDIATVLYKRTDHLQLRLGQLILVEKTSRLIKSGYSNVLWYAKPRSGKSYALAGMINLIKPLRSIIITAVPNETRSQFIDGIFYKYHDFKNFRIVDLNGDNIYKYEADNTRHEVIFVSKQLLEKHENIVNYIGKIGVDAIFYDEKHFAATTDLAKRNLAAISSLRSKHIYMSATADKVIVKDTISDSCVLRWDLEDEAICKRGDMDALVARHGDTIHDLIARYDVDELKYMMEYYKSMPTMIMMSYYIDSKIGEIVNTINDAIGETNNGFSPSSLFSLNTIGNFKHHEQVKRVVKLIFGDMCYRIKGIVDNSFISFMEMIRNINHANDAIHARDIIWFLPEKHGKKIAEALEVVLKQMKITDQYQILHVFGENDDPRAKLQSNIDSGGRTILLVGKKWAMGVSLPTVDIAIMGFGSNESQSDMYIQKAFRCMTESKGKKFGFVIDLSPCRVIHSVIQMSDNKKHHVGASPNECIKHVLEYNCINLYFAEETKMCKVDNIDIPKLLDTYYLSPENKIAHLRRELSKLEINISKQHADELNRLLKPYINAPIKANKSRAKLNDQDSLETPSGISTTIINTDEQIQPPPKLDDIEHIKFSTVLPDLIILTCFATRYKHHLVNFKQCYIEFSTSPNTRAVLINHLITIHKITNIDKALSTIDNILILSVFGNHHIENIVARTRVIMHDLLDDPARVIEFLESNLPPKPTETRKYSEVFTPVAIINCILDGINECYGRVYDQIPLWRRFGDDIFANPHIRWFDPAAGMGQFPVVVYHRLMKGLQSRFPDPNKRKRHIIEHQLFMSEINIKNYYILTNLFGSDTTVNKNIHLGDSLSLNIEKTFGVIKFDVIMGNPPYSDEVDNHNTSNNMYQHFVTYYINKCRLMSYIMPIKWFSGGKKVDTFRKMMLEREDIYKLSTYEDPRKVFKGVNVEGGLSIFVYSELYKGECLFNGVLQYLRGFDVVVKEQHKPIITKIAKLTCLNSICVGRCYGINGNDERLHDQPIDGSVVCYTSKQKSPTRIVYINESAVKHNKYFNQYKVITHIVAGGVNKGFAKFKRVAGRGECHTISYMSFIVPDAQYGEFLIKYLNLQIVGKLLRLRKTTQIMCADTLKWIPLPPMDREWTNESLSEWIGLSHDEYKIIMDIPLK
nr:putative site-specific DNA-methyltransferase [Faustovirus mariensis]